ncbi:hypothetical protein LGH70_05870 [Hymenobacter sp. BT635]|uniref:Uncharacterized protein n=1 Tax=Hymenobacter nitidus TaxID=2880929 RepID=A0ABS8AA67_9BACT|nr:hypothetical protein [Hymenobacter nitidus]MCB2377099.1 hypothetical protein [Hymenobacter nitidus]
MVATRPLYRPTPARRSSRPDRLASLWFRHRWLAQRPTALALELSSRCYLLRLQAEALETEAAALQALLLLPAAA